MRKEVFHALVLASAALLVVTATYLQGTWTERWKPISRDAVIQAAEVLENRFPERFGDWELERQLESDPRELERAGAVGHVSRLYRNNRTKARVSAFVVCALPNDASAHTPDRCYPGAGFTIGESEHRVNVRVDEGRVAEAYTGTFVKSGQTLRIFWTYGVSGDRQAGGLDWVAPKFARIALVTKPAVYKLYAIADETRVGRSQSLVECENFISQLVPALDAALAGSSTVAPPPPGDAAPAPVETPPTGSPAVGDSAVVD